METVENKILSAVATAEKLRALRTEKKFTQATLAKKAGVPQTTISTWEKGGVPAAVVDFGKIALGLDETPDSILLATVQEKELSGEREPLPAALADDMMALTRRLISMHHKAGPGVSPITLARQAVNSIDARFLGRLPALSVVPTSAPPKSDPLPLSPSEVDEVLEYVGHLVSTGRVEKPLLVAFEKLGRFVERQADAQTKPDHAAEDAASGEIDGTSESGGAVDESPASRRRL